QQFVAPTLLVQFADGDADAFVVHLRRRRTEPAAADVRQVRDAERIGDEAAPAEYGPHHGYVVEVAGAEPGIIGDDDVTRPQSRGRIELQHVAQRDRRAADEHGNAEGALGDGVGIGVEHDAGQVVALIDDGRE